MSGTLHVLGVGPGDPELLTLKAVHVLERCACVFTPTARIKSQSVALGIAQPHLRDDAQVEQLHFPMTADQAELDAAWHESARRVKEELDAGIEAAFLTLGDPLLYSTSIYLTRALRDLDPRADIRIVPGIPAYGAAAALTEFAVGEGKHPVAIIPAADDLEAVRQQLRRGGTVVIMKVGSRLTDILGILEQTGLLEQSVFVSHAGMPDQRIETDLRNLRTAGKKTGYLSIILVHAGEGSV